MEHYFGAMMEKKTSVSYVGWKIQNNFIYDLLVNKCLYDFMKMFCK